MPELYRESMQKVPFQRCNLWLCTSVTLRTRRAVQSVTHHGMADGGEMYPDLVRPARLNLHFQQGKFAVRAINLLRYPPVRDGLTAWPALGCAARGHARATDHIAADSGIDG